MSARVGPAGVNLQNCKKLTRFILNVLPVSVTVKRTSFLEFNLLAGLVLAPKARRKRRKQSQGKKMMLERKPRMQNPNETLLRIRD